MKNRKKIENTTSKSKKDFWKQEEFFKNFLPPLLRRKKKKTRHALPISQKNKTKNLFSVGAHSEILACKTDKPRRLMSHVHPPIKQSKNTCHAPPSPTLFKSWPHPLDADLGCYYIRSTFLIYTPYVWSKLSKKPRRKKKLKKSCWKRNTTNCFVCVNILYILINILWPNGKIQYRIHQMVSRIICYYESTNFSRNWVCLSSLIYC